MKKLFSIMMALVLVLCLGITAFATENNGSITITNATVGKEYSVFKIFSATYAEGNIAYTLTDDTLKELMFGTNPQEYNIADEGADSVMVKAADFFNFNTTTKVVTLKEGLTTTDKANLFKYLSKLVNETTVSPVATETANSTTVEFTNLPYGYYLITSTLGSIVTIDSTNPHANVQDKNQTTITIDKKVNGADSTSANVGDPLAFTVEFNALNYKGTEKITEYNIHDALSSGWAKINIHSIKVYVNNTEIAAEKYTVSDTSSTSFKINIKWVDDSGNFLYDSSVPVKITYSATVTAAAASATLTANKNTATLTWSDQTSTDDTTTNVYNLGFTKVDGTDNTPLSGAKFGLYRDAACQNAVSVNGSNGVYTVGGSSTEIETPNDGTVVIMGLEAGTYYLKETAAPAGYNLMSDAKAIVVGGEGQSNINTYTVNNAETTIENFTGMELPSTGGAGTATLITIGTVIAMAFAVLLITHKKMSVYQD